MSEAARFSNLNIETKALEYLERPGDTIYEVGWDMRPTVAWADGHMKSKGFDPNCF